MCVWMWYVEFHVCVVYDDNQAQSLVEMGGRKALLETLQTQKNKFQKKTDIHEFKDKIQAHRASSKATRLFLTK